jgi:hypothetical protein
MLILILTTLALFFALLSIAPVLVAGERDARMGIYRRK